MNKLLILSSYAKRQPNSLRNNEITEIFGCSEQQRSEITDIMFKQLL